MSEPTYSFSIRKKTVKRIFGLITAITWVAVVVSTALMELYVISAYRFIWWEIGLLAVSFFFEILYLIMDRKLKNWAKQHPPTPP